jgi:septum formation protein
VRTGSSRGAAPSRPAPFVVLASRSPQREAILRQLRLAFRVAPSRHHETTVPGDPVATVVANASGKAREVAGRESAGLALAPVDRALAAAGLTLASAGVADAGRAPLGLALEPGHLVLGVDTVVVLDGRVLGKPADAAEAAAFLDALAGRRHDVVSGLCLLDSGGDAWTAHARTTVAFRALSRDAVAGYVATGEWRERAGAYAIQGVGSALVTAVDGDYWNVVGLPVALALDGLAHFGVAPFSWLTVPPTLGAP